MLVNFRKVKTMITMIPPITIGDDCFRKVKSYKLLGVWLDDDLKWTANTAHIIKKAVKRLYLLNVLKRYNAPVKDLKTFYTDVIRSVLECQIWNGSFTSVQSNDIERIQKKALKIIYLGMSYEHALRQSNLKTLKDRRDNMCVDLIKRMSKPEHKLHYLLPKTVSQTRERETRASGLEYYNYACRTERFKQSYRYAINKYDLTLPNS